jgi:hypothetical protein
LEGSDRIETPRGREVGDPASVGELDDLPHDYAPLFKLEAQRIVLPGQVQDPPDKKIGEAMEDVIGLEVSLHQMVRLSRSRAWDIFILLCSVLRRWQVYSVIQFPALSGLSNPCCDQLDICLPLSPP